VCSHCQELPLRWAPVAQTEAEIRIIPGHPGQKVSEIPSQPIAGCRGMLQATQEDENRRVMVAG
jgi:hypothetical protein